MDGFLYPFNDTVMLADTDVGRSAEEELMRFAVLGPLRCAGLPDVDLLRRREGRILAVLLLYANRTVLIHELIDMLWGERPPATARQQVQNCVTRLVRLLRGTEADLSLHRTNSGYLLQIRSSDLDAAVFEEELARARELGCTGQHAAAAQLLRTALDRWRGQVLLGVDLGPFAAAAARLEELRLTAIEERFGLELELGRHGDIVADLAGAVGSYPMRERLVGQLMLALARTGRTAEALAVFHHTRRLLREDLAVEPTLELQAVQLAILGGSGGDSAEADGASLADLTAPAATVDTRHQRLLTAVALAEAARRQLELALQSVRQFTPPGTAKVGATARRASRRPIGGRVVR